MGAFQNITLAGIANDFLRQYSVIEFYVNVRTTGLRAISSNYSGPENGIFIAKNFLIPQNDYNKIPLNPKNNGENNTRELQPPGYSKNLISTLSLIRHVATKVFANPVSSFLNFPTKKLPSSSKKGFKLFKYILTNF